MADEVEKEEANEEDKPEIFSVKKGEEGFSYSRRDFLVTAAAGAAAIGGIGAGIDALTPDGKPAGSAEGDESMAVKLEVEALGMLVLPLMKGIEHAWKITNQGQNASPKAVLRLTAAHDEQLRQDFSVAELAPGQAIEVPVSLPAPRAAGEYRYQWQLRLGDSDARVNEFIVKVNDATLAESAHPYANSFDYTWTINNPDAGAVSSFIHFSRIETEDNFDYIQVMDGANSLIQTFTGSYPNGVLSARVPGAVVKVRFYSDSSITDWGFLVDAIISNFKYIYLPLIHRPAPTPTSYVVCSCNTVDVCVCNLVCVCEAVCSCDGYCSCDTVCSCVGYCSCNSVCTCDSVHYWHPN
jgi:hypothetical protein